MIKNQEKEQRIFQSWGKWLEDLFSTILNIMKIMVLWVLSFQIWMHSPV